MGSVAGDHIWRSIASGVEVRLAHLGERFGCYDPDTGVIWIGHGLTQAERRSTLAHELIHAERGDEPCVSGWHEDKQERLVSELAARQLITLDKLAEALAWSQDETELAEELWVDVDTVQARLAHLTECEKDQIESRLWAEERGA